MSVDTVWTRLYAIVLNISFDGTMPFNVICNFKKRLGPCGPLAAFTKPFHRNRSSACSILAVPSTSIVSLSGVRWTRSTSGSFPIWIVDRCLSQYASPCLSHVCPFRSFWNNTLFFDVFETPSPPKKTTKNDVDTIRWNLNRFERPVIIRFRVSVIRVR